MDKTIEDEEMISAWDLVPETEVVVGVVGWYASLRRPREGGSVVRTYTYGYSPKSGAVVSAVLVRPYQSSYLMARTSRERGRENVANFVGM